MRARSGAGTPAASATDAVPGPARMAGWEPSGSRPRTDAPRTVAAGHPCPSAGGCLARAPRSASAPAPTAPTWTAASPRPRRTPCELFLGRSPPRMVMTSRMICPRGSNPAAASDAVTRCTTRGFDATMTWAPGTITRSASLPHRQKEAVDPGEVKVGQGGEARYRRPPATVERRGHPPHPSPPSFQLLLLLGRVLHKAVGRIGHDGLNRTFRLRGQPLKAVRMEEPGSAKGDCRGAERAGQGGLAGRALGTGNRCSGWSSVRYRSTRRRGSLQRQLLRFRHSPPKAASTGG